MRRSIAVIGVLLVAVVAACTPSDGVEPTPSPTLPATPTSTPTQTPSAPSPSPTSVREREIAAAQATFVEYWRQGDLVRQRGGADSLPAELKALTVGPARRADADELRKVKSDGYRSAGFGVVGSFSVVTMRLGDSPPEVEFRTCVDQSKVTVTKNGRPFSGQPRYIRISTLKLQKINGRWRVYLWGGDKVQEGFTCDNYS